jgi:hypothetical protein
MATRQNTIEPDANGLIVADISAAHQGMSPEDEKAHLGATHAAFGDFALWAARSSGSTISPRSRHSVPVQIAAHPTVCAW